MVEILHAHALGSSVTVKWLWLFFVVVIVKIKSFQYTRHRGAKLCYLNDQPADLLIILHSWSQILWSHSRANKRHNPMTSRHRRHQTTAVTWYIPSLIFAFCLGWWKNVNVGLDIRMLAQPLGERVVFFVNWQAWNGCFWHHGYF